jgi:hypothetical protein
MKPVQDVLDGGLGCRLHECWQGGIAVTDRGHRLTLPPALRPQRRAQQRMGLLGHAAQEGKSSAEAPLLLDLATDTTLEVWTWWPGTART